MHLQNNMKFLFDISFVGHSLAHTHIHNKQFSGTKKNAEDVLCLELGWFTECSKHQKPKAPVCNFLMIFLNFGLRLVVVVVVIVDFLFFECKFLCVWFVLSCSFSNDSPLVHSHSLCFFFFLVFFLTSLGIIAHLVCICLELNVWIGCSGCLRSIQHMFSLSRFGWLVDFEWAYLLSDLNDSPF